jgi:hypothetical protein
MTTFAAYRSLKLTRDLKEENSRGGLANMPWNSREFVVKDRDGRLLAFGANL